MPCRSKPSLATNQLAPEPGPHPISRTLMADLSERNRNSRRRNAPVPRLDNAPIRAGFEIYAPTPGSTSRLSLQYKDQLSLKRRFRDLPADIIHRHPADHPQSATMQQFRHFRRREQMPHRRDDVAVDAPLE